MAKRVELKSPAFQKRYDQNMRILKEFPWLWGIRQSWGFAYDKLSVGKADDDLRRFLYEEEPDQSIEVWAYIRWIRLQYRVERIEWRNYSPQYGIRIRDYCPGELEYIVLVQHVKGGDNVVALNHTKMHIYRPTNKDESLSDFVRIRPIPIMA
ncbi:MAG: hypothetical protein ABIP54_04950 [Candidatus Andersenbacteria bacterium]